MDAIHSLADTISTVFLIYWIKLAKRPPDEDHPFGHGRYEPLGGLLLGLLLTVMGGVLLVQQFFQFTEPSKEWIHPQAWVFPFLALIALEVSYQILKRTAIKFHSTALQADAVHYRVDALTSLFAMTALICASYFPQWGDSIDHLGAILIALFMMVNGFVAFRKNMNQLTDKIPEPRFFNRVKVAAKRVKGVKETEKIRIQSYGPDAHVNIDIEVEPQLSVELAHRISQQVRVEIQKEWPAVQDVTVHVEPYYAHDH